MSIEVVTLKTYPKFVRKPGERDINPVRSLLDHIAGMDLERATGCAWGSLAGLHRRARINASLNTEKNWP